MLQFQLPPPDVTLDWGLSFNRSRVIITRWSPGLMSRGRGVCPQVWCLGRGVLFHVNYPMMHLMYPTPLWTDRCLWKHYLLTTSFVSGKRKCVNFHTVFGLNKASANFQYSRIEVYGYLLAFWRQILVWVSLLNIYLIGWNFLFFSFLIFFIAEKSILPGNILEY